MNPLARLIVVIILAGCLLAPWRFARTLAALDLLLLVPAWFLVVRTRVSLVPAAGIAAAVSPVLFGAVMLGAMLLGSSPVLASWIAFGLFAAVFLFAGGGTLDTNAAEVRIARWLAFVCVVGAIAALTLPIAREWWRFREDSWFHAAVLERILNHGVPPVDPYFSPLRLQYMYFYHTILAGVVSLTGLGPFAAMILVNGVALGGCVFGFSYLTSFFSRRVWPRVLGAALLLLGMNGYFYLFYPIRLARAFIGDTTGTAMLAHFFPWSPEGHATATRLLSIEGNQVLFLDKFMLGTALSLALGLVCVILGLLVSARRGRWSQAHTVLYIAAIAGTLYLHAVIGSAVLVATLVLLALLIMVRSHTGDGAPSYTALAIFTVIAAVIAAPYIISVMPRGGGGQSLRFALQLGHTVGLFSDVLPALVLAIPFLRWSGREDQWRSLSGGDEGEEREDKAPPPPGGVVTGRLFGELSLSATGIIAMWTLIVLAMALVVDLPTNNETKFSFLLFIPLAAFATGGLNRLWKTARGRWIALVLVGAAVLPLNMIYYHQAWRDRSTFEITDDERAAYQFIERNTPTDALFIDSDDIVRVPVLGRRDLYWGNETYAFNWGYPVSEVRFRREVRDSTFGQTGLTQPQIDALRALDRPVYVLLRGSQFDRFPQFQRMNDDPFYLGRFFANEYAVFQMDFAAADSLSSTP